MQRARQEQKEIRVLQVQTGLMGEMVLPGLLVRRVLTGAAGAAGAAGANGKDGQSVAGISDGKEQGNLISITFDSGGGTITYTFEGGQVSVIGLTIGGGGEPPKR